MADNEEEVQAVEGNENQIRIYQIPASDQRAHETASIRVLVTRNQRPWRAQTMNLDSLSFETDQIHFVVTRNDQTMNLTSTSSSSANASIRIRIARNDIPTLDQRMNLGSISFGTDRIRMFFTQNEIPANADQTMNLGSTTFATRPLRVLVSPNPSENLALMTTEEEVEEEEEEEEVEEDNDDVSSGSRQLSPYAEPYIPQNPYLQVQHQTFRSNQSAEPNRGEQETFYQQYPMDVFHIFVPFLVPVMNQMQPVQSQGFNRGPPSYRGRGRRRRWRRG